MSNKAIGTRPGNRRLTLAAASGLISLLLGVSVYLLDRDWQSVLFLASFSTWQPGVMGWFGPLGPSLPSFFHAYGFALLIILALGGLRVSVLLGATGWFGIAVFLEALQSEPVGDFFLTMQSFFNGSVFGRAVEAYVVSGSFDTGDILAAAIGCLAAGAVAHIMEVPK
jgi:signal transduction histidine kinase